MQQLEAPIMGEDTDRLMMWKYCTSCEMITNIVPVSDSTWSLSFAMFLHILLHENQLVRRGASRPDATCSHSLHQEHLTCFGKGDQVATFRYSKLHVWDISTPPDKLAILSPSYSKDYIMKYLMEYKKAGSSVYSTVQEKLHQAKVENADSSCSLLTEQREELQAYRDRVEKLEEKINESENHGLRPCHS
jgi:1-phosphatidylinositol-3-phosphate 5-kinase